MELVPQHGVQYLTVDQLETYRTRAVARRLERADFRTMQSACRQCHLPLPLRRLLDGTRVIFERDADVRPSGYHLPPDNGRIIINLDMMITTRIQAGTPFGCCGYECDPIGLGGHESGTEIPDCYTVRAMYLQQDRVIMREGNRCPPSIEPSRRHGRIIFNMIPSIMSI